MIEYRTVMLTVVVSLVCVVDRWAIATQDDRPGKDLPQTLSFQKRRVSDGNEMIVRVSGKPCLVLYSGRGRNGTEMFGASVVGNDDSVLLRCGFDKGRLLGVVAGDEPPSGFFALVLKTNEDRSRLVVYQDTYRASDPNSETYIDLDFDGQFDVKGHWRQGAMYCVSQASIYAANEWKKVTKWLDMGHARSDSGSKSTDYTFIRDDGWVADTDVNSRPKNSPKVNDLPEDIFAKFVQWKEMKDGGTEVEVLQKWQDIEVSAVHVKVFGATIVGATKGDSPPFAVFVKPADFSLAGRAEVELNLTDGTSANIVKALVDSTGVYEVRVLTAGETGGLRIIRSRINGVDWDGQYYATVPGTSTGAEANARLIRGERYWDLGFDGRFDVKAIYNGNKTDDPKERLVHVDNEWLPAISLNIAEGWAVISRGGKEVQLRFVPNKGWVAPKGK
jgi:hypothetical protein